MNIGGFLPPTLAGMAAKQQEENNRFQAMVFGHDDDDYNNLARALARAAEEYMDKVLRGLNALSDEDIQDKLTEFKEFFEPQEPATEQEIADFAQKLAEFALLLEQFRANQGNKESLLASAAQEDEEYNDTLGFMRSQVPAGLQLQQKLTTEVAGGIQP